MNLRAGKKKIDGLLAAEMTALEQNRHSITFVQLMAGLSHRPKIDDLLTDQRGGFVQVWRHDCGLRKQFALINCDRFFPEQERAAGRYHHRIDDQRNALTAFSKNSRALRRDLGREKQSGLDRPDGKTLQQ